MKTLASNIVNCYLYLIQLIINNLKIKIMRGDKTLKELFVKVMVDNCGNIWREDLGDSEKTYYEFTEDDLLKMYDVLENTFKNFFK